MNVAICFAFVGLSFPIAAPIEDIDQTLRVSQQARYST